jgi:hypothetical protein
VASVGQNLLLATPELELERLVFINETDVDAKMARLRRRGPRGEPCRASVPHPCTTTFAAGLRLDGRGDPPARKAFTSRSGGYHPQAAICDRVRAALVPR